MALEIEAVYQNGVLRPLEQLNLSENEHVTISIGTASEPSKGPHLAVEYIESVKRRIQGVQIPDREEVRRRPSGISGSMAELIIEQRGER